MMAQSPGLARWFGFGHGRPGVRPVMFYAAMLALVLLAVETFSWAAIRLEPIRSAIYAPPAVSQDMYAAYRSSRDDALGWPSRQWLAQFTEGAGARKSPANRALSAAPVCASVYGDSFAFGEEVADHEAWTDVLAGRLGCRVNNYGVGGYGTDQALLRLQRHLDEDRDLGSTLILELMPDNINRIVNQWRYLLGGDALGFKPVFTETAAGFRLVPVFDGDYQAFRALTRNPAAVLGEEAFLPGADSFAARIRGGFPFTATLLRALGHRLGSLRPDRIGSRPEFLNYPSFYDTSAGPGVRKIRVLQHIIGEFSALCRQADRRCVFLLLPDAEILKQLADTGQHVFARFAEGLPPNVRFADASRALFEAAGSGFCRLYLEPDRCGGHLTAEGNRIVAEWLAQEDFWKASRY